MSDPIDAVMDTHGIFTAEEGRELLLPSLDLAAQPEPQPAQAPAKRRRRRSDKNAGEQRTLIMPLPDDDDDSPRKCKRKRVPEFDPQSGEWVDVRRFDRMPVTIEEAEEGERATKVPHGAYFVSLAHKRITGIIQLHARWLAKTKNQCSDYADVQRDLMEFFSKVLEQFNSRYAVHTTHPQFESIGKTRKRQQKAAV